MSDFVAPNTEYSNTDGNTEFYFIMKKRAGEVRLPSDHKMKE